MAYLHCDCDSHHETHDPAHSFFAKACLTWTRSRVNGNGNEQEKGGFTDVADFQKRIGAAIIKLTKQPPTNVAEAVVKKAVKARKATKAHPAVKAQTAVTKTVVKRYRLVSEVALQN